ncbi:MAG: GIY-YIG nuclease family protein [Candidatus Levyibacteriota bacterium]
MAQQYFVYILSNKSNTIYYVGVTNNLIQRVWQHKEKVVKGFTTKYNINKLVWFAIYENVEEAIKREKQLKAGSRQKKIELVDETNSEWRDLYKDIC